jgi:hypothetical protein
MINSIKENNKNNKKERRTESGREEGGVSESL